MGHSVGAVVAMPLHCEPAGHSEQVAERVVLEKVPGLQALQAAAPAGA